jgi:hypothetical protein
VVPGSENDAKKCIQDAFADVSSYYYRFPTVLSVLSFWEIYSKSSTSDHMFKMPSISALSRLGFCSINWCLSNAGRSPQKFDTFRTHLLSLEGLMLTLPKLDRVRLEDLPCLTSVNTVEEILQLIGGKHPIIKYLYRGFQLSTILLVEQEFFHSLHYYNSQEKVFFGHLRWLRIYILTNAACCLNHTG